MSDCDVCLNYDASDVQFFYSEKRKARKQHKCMECGGKIEPGMYYQRVGGKCEGEMWRMSICSPCFEINNVFSCDGPTEYGNLWENMEYIFPDLRVSSPCFNKLSMESRAFLTNRWWDWKERHSDN